MMDWTGLADDNGIVPEVTELLGEVPKRWGRMDLASRVTLVAVAGFLKAEGILPAAGDIGLVLATGDGCLATDLAFSRALAVDGVSPMLFGYTLANIPLAEAASHCGLTGPVYAVYGDRDAARAQAAGWLAPSGPASMMLTGIINISADGGEPTVELEVLKKQ